MIARPVDENGDMMPISYSEQMVDGAGAVAQIVRQRLLLYFGEWWEDETAGFRIPQFLADGSRIENVEMLVKYISSYVAGTDGVSAVDGASVLANGHQMVYSCVVHVGAKAEEVEVALDGILSAQY